MLSGITHILKKRALVNGTLFAGFSFINKGLTFFLLIILANYISPAEYGTLNLFSTVTVVVGYFIAMSSEGYWSVSYFREGESGLRKTYTCIVIISVVVLTFVMATLWIWGEKISNVLCLPKFSVICAVGICFFNVYFTLFLEQYRLEEKVWKYGLASCGSAIVNFILSIILVKNLMYGWIGRVYAQFTCSILFGIVGFVSLTNRRLFTRDFLNQLKPLLFWSMPIIPHLASTFIRQGCDRYIINSYHSIDDVGLFSFALNMVNIITMLGMGFNQSNSVDIYKTLGNPELSKEQKIESITKGRKLFLKVYVFCTMIVGVLGYFIFPKIMPQYAGSMNYFLLLTGFGFFTCLYYLWTNYLFFYKKTKSMMYITFGSSVAHLLLSIILTKYSLYYTASLYTFSQGLIVLLVRWQAQKAIKEHLSITPTNS